MACEGEDWIGETALESIRGLSPAEKKRLAERLASFRSAMKPLRTAASLEEPLFAPELESRRGEP